MYNAKYHCHPYILSTTVLSDNIDLLGECLTLLASGSDPICHVGCAKSLTGGVRACERNAWTQRFLYHTCTVCCLSNFPPVVVRWAGLQHLQPERKQQCYLESRKNLRYV